MPHDSMPGILVPVFRTSPSDRAFLVDLLGHFDGFALPIGFIVPALWNVGIRTAQDWEELACSPRAVRITKIRQGMGDCLPPIVRSWAELAAAFSNCVDVPGIYALEERRYHRPPPVEGTNTYEVDCIVAERRDRQTGEESVRVRWKGYPWSEGTWEPKEALQTSEVYKQWTLEREFVPTMRCPDPTFY